MDFLAIGHKIKELRKQMKLSQEELAEGICTQAQISKLEKGDVFPYASTLYLISQKLGVDVNYFFDMGMTPRLDYVNEVINQLRNARRTMNYQEIRDIVVAEENNPLFKQHKRNYQLLLWHKGIYHYELYRDSVKSINILKDAILLTQTSNKVHSEREIEILLSIGVILFEEKQLKKALSTYKDAYQFVNTIPYLVDNTVKIRIYYNTARTLTRLQEYEKSNNFCLDGIEWCIQKSNLYLLGELHYHTGYNYELLGDLTLAEKYMEKAKLIFNLQNDTRFTSFISQKLDNWKTL
ncbi:helix-turn-helix domain-containing protein [Peribacillus sp. NPDC096379]|uniref:helix-turn-helix domain-containing protein n=1 Tax=Peribacillus sp. NPDC096379 TaxID=3364393 RepID=UPI0038135DB9